MFVRASTLVLAVAACALAAPADSSSQCDTGNLQCCNAPQAASALPSVVTELLGLLGVAVPTEGSIAFNCSPITAVGVGSGSQCSQQPICCDNTNQSGLINIACVPLNLDL